MSEKFASDPAMMRLAGGMEYILWLTLIGKSRTTGWRWRQPGPSGEPPRVVCCRIDNTWYISQKEIDRFWMRAEVGEFAGEPAGVCAGEEAA
jgi:hypothetical protein